MHLLQGRLRLRLPRAAIHFPPSSTSHFPMSSFPSLFSFGSSSGEKKQERAVSAATSRLEKQVSQLRAENHALKSKQEEKPLFAFGVIADIQYADIEDAQNHAKTEMRRYRFALEETDRAVQMWNAYDKVPLAFIAQLGDIIDGQNAGKYGQGLKLKEPVSYAALQDVLEKLERTKQGIPFYHCVGNHEMYNFTWKEMEESLNKEGRHKISEKGKFYYSFRPALGWTVVVLNAYDICTMQDENSDGYKIAREILEKENPNDVFSQGKVNYFEGLKGEKCRFVPFNGGIGNEQLSWLTSEVEASKERGDMLIVLTHIGLHHRAGSWKTVVFNYDEVMDVLKQGNLVAVLAGHRHAGGYYREKRIPEGKGFVEAANYPIHHLTFKSPLTFDNSFDIIEVYNDRLELKLGNGLPSKTLQFNYVW